MVLYHGKVPYIEERVLYDVAKGPKSKSLNYRKGSYTTEKDPTP